MLTADEVYESVVKRLEPTEQLRLAERIQRELSEPEDQTPATEPERERRSWASMIGRVPYPFFGEDAQEYISRTRRESDERREKQLHPE